MPLTKDEELYYENYFDLFNSNGWKQFIDEQKYALEELKNNAFNGGEEDRIHLVATVLNCDMKIFDSYPNSSLNQIW